MSKFNLSLIALLAVIVPSGATAIYLANQAELTNPQTQVLETSIKICYGSTLTLSGVLAAKPKPRKKDKSDDNTDNTDSTDKTDQ